MNERPANLSDIAWSSFQRHGCPMSRAGIIFDPELLQLPFENKDKLTDYLVQINHKLYPSNSNRRNRALARRTIERLGVGSVGYTAEAA